jgi:hypothetical protein
MNKIVEVPIDLLSSQRIELDDNGIEYIIDLKWISQYQRFYMDVRDSVGNPIIESLKVIPGAPLNLPNLGEQGPLGVFVVVGSGDLTRRSFDQQGYTLYYVPRGEGLFPLDRGYLVETTLNTFLIENKNIVPQVPPQISPVGDYNTYRFDGDDYINCGNGSTLQITGAMTYAFWMRPLGTDVNSYPASKWTSGGGQRSWIFNLGNGTNLNFAVSGDGTTSNSVAAASSITVGNWYFIVGRYDGSTLKLFINGLEAASINYSGGIFNGTSPLQIGGVNNATTDAFEGSMTYHIQWPRALSPEEMLNLYNLGVTPYWESLPTSLTDGTVLAVEMTSRDNTLTDLSGNGNDGTVVGDASDDGELHTFGPYLQSGYNTFGFNGSTEYISLGNPASLQITSNLSIGAWIYPTAQTGSHPIVSKWNTSGVDQRAIMFHLVQNSGDKLEFTLSSDGVNTSALRVDAPASNQWSYVEAVYDGTNQYIYINGVEAGSQAYNSGIHNSTAEMQIGSLINSSNSFEGSMTRVVVNNTARSSADILKLHNNGVIPYYETIDADLKTGDVLALELSSRDDSANDLSGNGNNGTKNGGISADGALAAFGDFAPPEVQSPFSFDGSASNIDFGNVLDFGNVDFAFTGWFKIDPAVAGTDNIIRRYDSSGSNPVRCYMLRYLNSTGQLQWAVQGGGAFTTRNISINTDQLYFFYCYYDASAQRVGVSVNAGSIVSGDHTAGINSGGNTNFYLGYTGSSLLGSLTTVTAYNSLLTSQEQTDLYNEGVIPYYETLPTSITDKIISSWELSGRDATANDLKGSNNGTINGPTPDGTPEIYGDYSA